MDVNVVNGLLRSLPPELRAEVVKAGRLVRLRKGRTLYQEGEVSTHAYFLQSGLASVVLDTSAGEQVEVAMIGSEGVVGLPTLFGPVKNVTRCLLQMEATAFEIPMSGLCTIFEEIPIVRRRLLEYIQIYLYGTERVAACNRVHLAPERLVRWLLMAQLYSGVGQFPFTHDFLAHMVAVQRTTVSAALNGLQAEGLLDHGWGTIVIKDTERLEKKACSCYQVLKILHQNLYREEK